MTTLSVFLLIIVGIMVVFFIIPYIVGHYKEPNEERFWKMFNGYGYVALFVGGGAGLLGILMSLWLIAEIIAS